MSGKGQARHRRLGRALILAGVAVWVPYALLELAGADPRLEAFLPFHLAGVIPGAILSRWDQLRGLLRRLRGG